MGGHCAQYIALRHLYITSFALRCADGAPVLGSIYLKTVNLYRIKADGFFSRRKAAVREGRQAYRQCNCVIVPAFDAYMRSGPLKKA